METNKTTEPKTEISPPEGKRRMYYLKRARVFLIVCLILFILDILNAVGWLPIPRKVGAYALLAFIVCLLLGLYNLLRGLLTKRN